MSLRFFSDQCVPAEITDILRRDGHQVTSLREVLPICSPDPAVISNAQEDAMTPDFQHDVFLTLSLARLLCAR